MLLIPNRRPSSARTQSFASCSATRAKELRVRGGRAQTSGRSCCSARAAEAHPRRKVALDNAAQRYMHRDGTTLKLRAIASEVHDRMGATVCYVTQFQDVTARQATAESAAGERGEARFRTLFETSPNGMDIVDRDGKIVLTNAALRSDARLRRRTSLPSSSSPDLTHPDDRRRPTPRWWRHARQARILRAGEALPAARTEARSGSISRCLRWPTRVAARSSSMGIREDITERKRNEVALAGSEARARAMLDSALDAIVTIGRERRILRVQPRPPSRCSVVRARTLSDERDELAAHASRRR